MGKTNTTGSIGSDGYHRILFSGPGPGVGPGDLAERLVNMRLFEDLSVESHRDGYVAKVRFFPGHEPKKLNECIAKAVGKEFRVISKT